MLLLGGVLRDGRPSNVAVPTLPWDARASNEAFRCVASVSGQRSPMREMLSPLMMLIKPALLSYRDVLPQAALWQWPGLGPRAGAQAGSRQARRMARLAGRGTKPG